MSTKDTSASLTDSVVPVRIAVTAEESGEQHPELKRPMDSLTESVLIRFAFCSASLSSHFDMSVRLRHRLLLICNRTPQPA
jgi:hypothetical protein